MSKYNIGGRSFRSKKQLTAAVQRIRDSVMNTMRVEETDVPFVVSVLKNHKNWCNKSTLMSHIIVVDQGIRNTRCFYIVKSDGQREDISFVKAIQHLGCSVDTITKREHTKNVYKAGRCIVQNQIDYFRRYGPDTTERRVENPDDQYVKSAKTGVRLNRFSPDTHIDHEPPFSVLFARWMKKMNLDIQDIETTEYSQGLLTFFDLEKRQSWHDYHKENACLFFLTKHENLTKH